MEQFYKLSYAAKKLSVCKKTIYRWIATDKIKTVMVNGQRRIAESELKKFIKEE